MIKNCLNQHFITLAYAHMFSILVILLHDYRFIHLKKTLRVHDSKLQIKVLEYGNRNCFMNPLYKIKKLRETLIHITYHYS
jgi:hypothetical protein